MPLPYTKDGKEEGEIRETTHFTTRVNAIEYIEAEINSTEK